MVDHKQPDKASEFEQIAPAKIEIAPRSGAAGSVQAREDAAAVKPSRPRVTPTKFYVSFAVLLGVALLVFLFLPRWVPEPEPQLAEQQLQNLSSAKKPESTISPWQEAQAAKAREEAQKILEQMLDKRFELQELKVERWALQEFEQAHALADQGDEAYRQRDFDLAISRYRESLDLMQGLLERVDTVVSDFIEQGFAAIASGDANAASEAFKQALDIRPDEAKALKGELRAASLDEVLGLLAQARQKEAEGEFETALELYKQIRGLDSETQGLQSAAQRINQKIKERDYSAAMSAGFSALGRGDAKQAAAEFRRAIALEPGSSAAKDGLDQALGDMTHDKVTQHREAAERFIGQEQWAQAEAEYQAVLKLDASLAFAQEGVKRTGVRARLDELLQASINQPERLAADGVYQETQNLLQVARKVEAPGARLQGQIAKIESLLQQAATPVPVTITSDNQTDVTLYKVGHLGSFMSRTLELTPGQYAIVGKRTGYRDVRHEFKVSFNQEPPAVVVQCTDKI